MAYNYLSLVNSVCARFNEVPLTSSNFSSADGVYNDIKEYVNTSIREINTQAFEWPFNHTTANLVLTSGVNRYTLSSDTKTVDFDSFRIRANDSLSTQGGFLRPVNYEEYVKRFIQEEYFSNTSVHNTPRLVFRLPSRGFGVYPIPDKAYELDYEYYTIPDDLVLPTDTPTLPFQFNSLIVDGGSRGGYLFRGDIEGADRMEKKFTDGIGKMRDLYIDRVQHFVDTRVHRGRNAGFIRVN